MRLNGLIVFVLASFVSLLCFVGQSDARVIVVGGNQPEATLAPAGAVVLFTNFKIRPGTRKNRGLELKKIIIEKTGFGSLDSVADFLVIAKKSPGVSEGNTGRIVLSSSVSSKDNIMELVNLPEDGGLPAFTKPVELMVAARMNSNLEQYAGQVIYLQVKSIVLVRKKTGREVKIKGKFPIVGVGNTINSTLKIGSLSVEAKDDATYALMAESEPIRIPKIVIRTTPSLEEGEPNSYFLYIEKTGQLFALKREGSNMLYVTFEEEIVVEKGETLKIEIRQDEGNLLWEFFGIYPEDIEAYGDEYNYRIMPQWWVAKG